MSDTDFALELRRHLLALVAVEDHPIKRRALLGIVASIEKRHGTKNDSGSVVEAAHDQCRTFNGGDVINIEARSNGALMKVS